MYSEEVSEAGSHFPHYSVLGESAGKSLHSLGDLHSPKITLSSKKMANGIRLIMCLPYFAIIQPTEAVSVLYFLGRELELSRYPKDYSEGGLRDPSRKFSCSRNCGVVPELWVPQTWDAGAYCFGLPCSDSNLSQCGASMAGDNC